MNWNRLIINPGDIQAYIGELVEYFEALGLDPLNNQGDRRLLIREALTSYLKLGGDDVEGQPVEKVVENVLDVFCEELVITTDAFGGNHV